MRILIFGGHGTIGKPLVKMLEENHKALVPIHKDVDLLDLEQLVDYFKWHSGKVDIVLNLAAEKTNISKNNTNPVEIYENTVQMGMNIFRCCKNFNVSRIIQFACSCSYPPRKLLNEEDFDNGRPHPSIESHAQAKRQLYYLAKFYKKEYGIITNTVIFNNVYGDLTQDKNILKVLDALFLRVIDAKVNNKPEVEIWGSGKVRREFIHFSDAAMAIYSIVNSQTQIDLLNIGCQEDISIKKLAKLLTKKIGYKGKLVYDQSKPDGQLRKLLDSSTFRFYFPDFKFTSLEEGIDKMIEEYCK